jgi:cytoskeletal protein CcmA (bactofilin family)
LEIETMRQRNDDEFAPVTETVIGTSLHLEGDLKSQGDIKIEGEVQGTVSTEGSVSITSSAKVVAGVQASNVEIAGSLEGDVTAKQRISLSETARVKGNLSCAELVIAQGAQFTGASSMSGAEKVEDKVKKEAELPSILKADVTV